MKGHNYKLEEWKLAKNLLLYTCKNCYNHILCQFINKSDKLCENFIEYDTTIDVIVKNLKEKFKNKYEI